MPSPKIFVNGLSISQDVNAIFRGLIALASNRKRTSLLRLVSVQHLVWVLEDGAGTLHVLQRFRYSLMLSLLVDRRLLARAQIKWMEGLWNLRLDDDASNFLAFVCVRLLLFTFDTTR